MARELTVRALQGRAVSVPMKRALGTSAQTIREAPLLLLDLFTEEGVTGRAYLFCYVPSVARALLDVVEGISAQIRHDAVAPQDIAAKLARQYRLVGVRGVVSMAMAGLDVACWDALAIAAGMPLARFLGAAPKPVPAYNSNGLGLIDPAGVGAEAAQLVDEGFGAIKLRLGRPALDADVQAIRAAREATGADVHLMVDFNQALDVTEALERGRAIDQEGAYWIEEPIHHDDYQGYATLCRELSTPVQLGENFQGTRPMAAAIAARAGDFMMPDLERIGGVTGWMRAAALADAAGIRISSHLFPEVSAHLLAASPTGHWLEYVDWAGPLLQQPLVIRDGAAHVPATPGAGLLWDESAVARYRM
ncbi:MAG TPA: enolase C-terminal domain-like protein [Burkholderiales bacterium]|nr:enolase C-terminal domain-like protein [Burkholderiales bacterium]